MTARFAITRHFTSALQCGLKQTSSDVPFRSELLWIDRKRRLTHYFAQKKYVSQSLVS